LEVWLDAELEWSEATAKKFIVVAKAFHSPSIVTSELTIEDMALYALSAPEVPQAARAAAVWPLKPANEIGRAKRQSAATSRKA